MEGDWTLMTETSFGTPPSAFPSVDTPPSSISIDLAGGSPSPPIVVFPSDSWGPLKLPLQAPQPPLTSNVAGDPAVDLLLTFLYAFLVTDKAGDAVWQAQGVAPNIPLVRVCRAWNPSDAHADHRGLGLSVNDLPALYMWRDSAKAEKWADDWDVDVAELKLLWIFPKAVQAGQRVREPFANALFKLIYYAIEKGRTPSLVFPGDIPQASVYGSLIYTPMNCVSVVLKNWKPARAVVEGDEKTMSFAAVEFTIELVENMARDPALYDPTYSLDLKIITPGETEESLFPT